VGIEITNRCNLACRHCFNRSGEGRVEELPLTTLVALFDQCRAMGLTGVRISGGEPTLHCDFPAVVTAAMERGLAVTLNTNGCFRPEIQDRLSTLPIASFLVSLDGLEANNDHIRGRGTFVRATETVRWLRSTGRGVTLGVHLSRVNLADVEGLIALAASLDASIKFAPVRPIGRAADGMAGDILSPVDFYRAVQTITRLRPIYPDIRITTDFDILQPVAAGEPALPARASCPAGRTMLNVGYDGYVYPCAFLITREREFAAGHINQTPLDELWRESAIFTPFRSIEKDSQCRGCSAYGRSCVGGCLAMSYFTAGCLDAHDPLCFVALIPTNDLKT
jgi:radical SAM protein with 4Fe4S-binding SPASM domain